MLLFSVETWPWRVSRRCWGRGLFCLADLVCGHMHVESVPTLLKQCLSGFCHTPVSTANMPQDLDLCHCIQHFTWILRPGFIFRLVQLALLIIKPSP